MAAESRFEVSDWKLNLVKSYFDRKNMKHDLNVVEDLKDATLEEANVSELNISIEIPSEVHKVKEDKVETLPENNSKHFADVCESNVDDESNSSRVEDSHLSPSTTPNISRDEDNTVNDSFPPKSSKTNLSDEILICSPSSSQHSSLKSSETITLASTSSTSSNVSSTRPKLVKNKCQFPIKIVKVLDDRDQGRNCVFVVIKSRSGDSRLVRQRTVSRRSRKVENLVAKFELKYEAKFISDVRAVYNFCFVSPLKARKFFADVNDVIKNDGYGPNSVCIFLCDEEMLGKYRFALLSSSRPGLGPWSWSNSKFKV